METMQYRNLGKAGVKVSVLSLGSWVTFGRQVDVELAKTLIKYAYDHGVNFFDNAEVYGRGRSEQIMGEAFKQLGLPRDSYMVSSKVFFGSVPEPLPTQKGLSRKHIFEACHQALKRLQTDYLDLYFCHRPDPEVPVEEIVWSMHQLIMQGKVLYWGTSEWSAVQIMHAHLIAQQHHLVPPVMEQPQYNLFFRKRVEDEYDYLYKTVGLGTTIWSPLASGYLTGKYLENPKAEGRFNLPKFEWLWESVLGNKPRIRQRATQRFVQLAEKLAMTPAQLAIAWCLKNPNVSTVILGASKLEQLKENLDTLQHLDKLTPKVMEKIEKIMLPASDKV